MSLVSTFTYFKSLYEDLLRNKTALSTFTTPDHKEIDMIPMISSLCYGPLGACQLPRTWWKVLLRKANLMDEEYPDFSGGLDRGVFEALNLDQDTTLTYLRDNMPSYLDFEAWILKQKGDAFFGFEQQDAIIRWNAKLRARRHNRPEKIQETYNDIGLPSNAGIDSAIVLNSLQDWQLFFKRDLNSGYATKLGGRVVPLVATIDYGPLGVRQLPRTWYKIALKAKRLLHPDYPDMTGGGLDPRALKALNLDIDKTLSFIRTSMPSYLDFEAWVLAQNNGKLPGGAVDEWNDYLCNRIHNDSKREDIHATIDRKHDDSLKSAIILNQIEDWHLAHQDLINNL